MKKGEPPSRSCPMLIGRNSRGQWVVRSLNGLCGGLFVNRTEALRFALFENGHRPEAAIMVSGVLELGLRDPADAAAASQRIGETDLPDRRSAANTLRRLFPRRAVVRPPRVAAHA